MKREPVRASRPSEAGLAASPRVRSQRVLQLGRITVLIVVTLAVAMASNIGSTATITGDAQNIAFEVTEE